VPFVQEKEKDNYMKNKKKIEVGYKYNLRLSAAPF